MGNEKHLSIKGTSGTHLELHVELEAVCSIFPQFYRRRAVEHRRLRLGCRSVAQRDNRVPVIAAVNVHARTRFASLRGLLRRHPLELETCDTAVCDPLAVTAGEIAVRL